MKDLKTTARNLIDKSFKTIGVLGVGERATDEEAFDALDLLNEIIAKFNNEDMFFIADKETVVECKGESFYLLDNISVDGIKDIFYNSSSEYSKLNPMSKEQSIMERIYQGSPSAYFFDYMFPTSKLTLFPNPTSGTLKIITNGRFDLFDSLDSIVYMPDGWEICLRYNLAVRLCSEYGREPSQQVIQEAVSTKALLKNTAQKMNPKKYYSDYPGCDGSAYNIMRGY